MCDSGVIMQGEIRWWSLFGVEGLKWLCLLTLYSFSHLCFKTVILQPGVYCYFFFSDSSKRCFYLNGKWFTDISIVLIAWQCCSCSSGQLLVSVLLSVLNVIERRTEERIEERKRKNKNEHKKSKKKGEEKKEKKTRQGRMRKKEGDLKISTKKSQYCE